MAGDHRGGSPLGKVALALVCVTGLGILAGLLHSGPRLSASGKVSLLSLFQSPIGDPQLAISKSVDNTAPHPDDEIVYTLTYSSTKPGSQAFDVRIYDFLPTGATFLSADPPQASYENGVLVFVDPSVGPVDETVAVRVRVLGGYEYLSNYALVSAHCITPVHASLLTPVSGSSSQSSLLRVAKTGPPVVLVGDELVYTLQCANTSGLAVDEVEVVDVLATGLPLVGVSSTPDVNTLPLLKWSVGTLGPDVPWTTVVTSTAPARPGVIANTLIASGRGAVMTETLFTTHVVTAVLHLTKTCSAPVVGVGGTLVYSLVYDHEGDELLVGGVVTDIFPADVTIEATDPAPATLTPEWGVWHVGPLSPGESGEIVITATVGGSPDRTLHNVADFVGPATTWPARAELLTPVWFTVHLPLVLRDY